VPAGACGFVGLRKFKELLAILGREMKNAVAAVATQCPPPPKEISRDGYSPSENEKEIATRQQK
jgi:hypothetical protein